MPVSDEHALRQFEIEALRQITDNLRRLNEGQAELLKSVHEVDKRLTRIESNSVDGRLKLVETAIEVLEKESERRKGAIGLVEWAAKHWPAFIGFVFLVAIVLKSNGLIQL